MTPSPVILAVASPPGRSLRGIVRVSGDAAFELLRPHLTLAANAPWTRRAHNARLRVGS